MNKITIKQYLHRPNTTELGMGNTHETYLSISKNIDLTEMFPPSVEVQVEDTYKKKTYMLKSAVGREFRINQMGEIYRDYGVQYGDEIILTKVIGNNNQEKLYLNVKMYYRVVLIVRQGNAEICNLERLDEYKLNEGKYRVRIYDKGTYENLDIEFYDSLPKRSDSPNKTDFYSIKLNNNVLPDGTYYLNLSDKSCIETFIKSSYNEISFKDDIIDNIGKIDITNPLQKYTPYRPYITAIKSKPFLLLAGISGTGKSRIVRELARACWEVGSNEYKAQVPPNFKMIQVKPNWHDSSELIGYVSRINGEPEFVAGEFLKFVAKAWEHKDTPYFLCLDEMNLAPVEQYFAEYLSVIESRKTQEDGTVLTDPILNTSYHKDSEGNIKPDEWYEKLILELLTDCPDDKSFALKTQFEQEGISIPQNLIVVGTVNMDETTFSFSRKVLDRAMTIEMNYVNLKGGLEEDHEQIGKLGKNELIGTCVEGKDVYKDNKEVCDDVIKYLQAINDTLDHTPFKIAYRTRNEFLLYVVNNLPYNEDEKGNDIPVKQVIARALDEITSMKILSRIEGDDSKVKKSMLSDLRAKIIEKLTEISKTFDVTKSVSITKIDEMYKRLDGTGYTSFWS